MINSFVHILIILFTSINDNAAGWDGGALGRPQVHNRDALRPVVPAQPSLQIIILFDIFILSIIYLNSEIYVTYILFIHCAVKCNILFY